MHLKSGAEAEAQLLKCLPGMYTTLSLFAGTANTRRRGRGGGGEGGENLEELEGGGVVVLVFR